MDPIKPTSFGELLKYWRKTRNYSQTDLAVDCDTSARHLSCVENERAHPSRHLLLRLCAALEIPLRARNTILIAAGYMPLYKETGLSEPEMNNVRLILEKILAMNEPFPTVLLDRSFNIVLSNQGFGSFIRHFVADQSFLDEGELNLLRLLFHPRGAATHLVNLPYVYNTMVERVRRGMMAGGVDTPLSEVLEEIRAYRPKEEVSEEDNLAQLVMPIHLKKNDKELSLFTVSATLGAPLDITLQELLLESAFPTDADSEQFLRALATE